MHYIYWLCFSFLIQFCSRKWNKSTQRLQTSPRPLQCRAVVSEHISCKMSYLLSVAPWRMTIYRIKCASTNVKESEKLILDPHPDPDQHQNFIVSRGSPLVHAYHVWSTSVNTFVSCPAHRQLDRMTDRITERNADITPPDWVSKLLQSESRWMSGVEIS